jgi:hypothetical protein
MKRRVLSGEEQDAYSPYWRKAYCYLQRAGVIHKIKRRTHKRERREGQAEARAQREDRS